MIPFMGYPSRASAIRALLAEGKTPTQITTATGLSRELVDTLIAVAGTGSRALFRAQSPRDAGATERVPLDREGVVVGVLPAAARATRLSDIRPASSERASREHKARTLPRYLLRKGDQYLHFSGRGLTDRREYAWIGFKANLPAIRKASPEAGAMTPVEVPPPSRGEFQTKLG